MNYKILNWKLKYDGSQLNPDFSFDQGMREDNVVAFSGPAEVKKHLVDLEDKKNNDFIKSKDMLHFIITLQGNSIVEAVLWQRLFIHCIVNCTEFVGNMFSEKDHVRVEGDDIMVNAMEKLSVSIATVSPTKMLIHIGLNWDAGENIPVKIWSLSNRLMDTEKKEVDNFKDLCMEAICREIISTYKDVKKACFKVKTF